MGGARAVIARGAAPRALEDAIRAQAYGLGFDLAGITSLGTMQTAPHFDRWLERGYAGDMHYLPKWAHKRGDSRLPNRNLQQRKHCCRPSVLNYWQGGCWAASSKPLRNRISPAGSTWNITFSLALAPPALVVAVRVDA